MVYPFVLPTKRHSILLMAMALGLTGCANIPYLAKPVEPQQVTQKLIEKDPLSAEFKAFCIEQGYPQDKLPFTGWGIKELTLSALYHHTRLDVAKAQLGTAKAAIESAGIKTSPNLGAHVARSNRANGDINPFSYGLNVDIPIETTSKRALRVEEAQHLAEAARLDVAETGWSLHAQLKQDWLNYHEQQAKTTFLHSVAAKYDKLAELMAKRVHMGLASGTDLAPILTQQAKTHAQLAQISSQKDGLIASMAADAGLTKAKFEQIPVAPLGMEDSLRKITDYFANPEKVDSIQSDALLNRIDIRRSLARYAAAESKIQLEVAKQTPDISISPGFLFEYGDKIWSLGFSGLLNMLNKNPALIREAEQLRATEGARFEALQAQVIAEIAQAKAKIDAARQQMDHANINKDQQLAAMQKLQKQFDAGLTDKLEMTQAQAIYNNHMEDVLNAQFGLLRATERFEDTMQRTLYIEDITETTTP